MTEPLFPKATRSRKVGNSGVIRVSRVINDDFGWIFRRVEQGDDFGIDAFADIVNVNDGVTGQSIAIQVKYGASYLREENGALVHHGEARHLSYYANSASPVLLIVGSENTALYWQFFRVEDTERSGTGWKLSIPKSNVFDERAKTRIEKTVGPPFDGASAAEAHWAFGEFLDQHSVILYAIDPDDIEKCDVQNVVDFTNRLLTSGPIARKASGKLDFFTPAFDDDPREVWEIPEMRRWVEETEKAGIPWFLLCRTHPSNIWLRVYFAMLCNGKRSGVAIKGGKTSIRIEMDPQLISRLLKSNFIRLNQYTEKFGFSEADNKRLSLAATKAIGLPIPSKPKSKTKSSRPS